MRTTASKLPTRRAVDAGRVGAMPGAAEALAEMREIGIHICLTTGFAPATRDRILGVLGWDDLVDLALSPCGRRPRPPVPRHDPRRGRPPRDRRCPRRRDRRRHRQRPSRGTRAGAGIVAGVLTGAHDRAHARDRAAHPHPRLDCRPTSGFTPLRPRGLPGILAPHARNGSRPGRQPVQAAGLRVPVGRDLRRIPLHLRLRPARRAHAAQREGRLGAGDGPTARRHRADRRRDPVAARDLGGERPPPELHRSARRLHGLQPPLPGGPARPA